MLLVTQGRQWPECLLSLSASPSSTLPSNRGLAACFLDKETEAQRPSALRAPQHR